MCVCVCVLGGISLCIEVEEFFILYYCGFNHVMGLYSKVLPSKRTIDIFVYKEKENTG